MKLTEAQSKLVEDNHNLIYWYMNRRGLDNDEWYGLIAIELCKTAMKYDETLGAFSTYFKVCADNIVSKEFSKASNRFATRVDCYAPDDMLALTDDSSLEEEVVIEELIESDWRGIVRLKMQGYTQVEIAEKLKCSQGYVSRILARLKKEFYNE